MLPFDSKALTHYRNLRITATFWSEKGTTPNCFRSPRRKCVKYSRFFPPIFPSGPKSPATLLYYMSPLEHWALNYSAVDFSLAIIGPFSDQFRPRRTV